MSQGALRSENRILESGIRYAGKFTMKAALRSLLGIGAIGLLPASAGPAWAEMNAIQFQNVTSAAGISQTGASWGSMWGDFDGDGLPDLWLVNHWDKPSLYRNQGNGSFVDVIDQVVSSQYYYQFDCHGAAWADFDNDGDQDLYQLGDGGSSPVPALLFVNNNGLLEERAAQFGLDYLLGRGRMPLWLDYDRDGLLDVLHPTTRHGDSSDAPTALFHQTGAGFTDVASQMGLVPNVSKGSNFALLADLSGDGAFEMITHLTGRFPDKVYDMTAAPFQDVVNSLGIPVTAYPVVDAVAADLDGDLDNDLFVVRGEKEEDFVQVSSYKIEAHLESSGETGLRFAGGGLAYVDLYPKFLWTTNEIYIGSTGYHPAALDVTLSSADTTSWGIVTHVPGANPGLYIGYDTGTQTWEVLRAVTKANLIITSSSSISAITAIGWDPATPPADDRLLVNLGGSFVDGSQSAGFLTPSSGRSVVAGDFDNDMDLDLYIVSTGPVENLPNTLYENLGSGSFAVVSNAGGAAGNSLGRGDAVTTADYDGDGFLDLVVTNGVSKSPFELDGTTELYRNLGNLNHWIEIDLEGGAYTNRDGIGARVIARAGGKAQLREQNGGIHYRGQNHSRLHFGLGSNTLVDTLTVFWPGSVAQEVYNVPVDQVLHLVEPIVTEVQEPATGEEPPSVTRLIGCSPNPFNPSTTIAFSLDRAEPVRLSIHDATGRRVRRLIVGEIYPAGANEIFWGGRNDAGERVSSGVYFLKLEAGPVTQTSKIVLLK